MSILRKLTESVVERDLNREGQALRNKWEASGLLEGLGDERQKDNMSLMLENQAKELLREASSMSVGDVEGFAAVAFPIVRRVFGNLIANDLVSVQPLQLPTGLIFFLDFTYTDSKASGGATVNDSVYGGGVIASQITGGMNLTDMDNTTDTWNVEKGAYSLNNSYSTPTSSATVTLGTIATNSGPRAMRSGSGTWVKWVNAGGKRGDSNYVTRGDSLIQYDPDLSGSIVAVYTVPKSNFTNMDTDNLVGLHTPTSGAMARFAMVRRLTRKDPLSSSNYLVVFATANSGSVDANATDVNGGGTQWSGSLFTYPVTDTYNAATAVGAVVGATPFGFEFQGSSTGLNDDIPEIDVKVDSISVTAKSKKLKAVWTPELGQDLNAYHNLDAEVELTSVLSEHVALEIDREILNDLVKGATAATYYWSRRPGKFVNKSTGLDLTSNGANLPDFTGNVSEWYQTLIETVNDVSAQIHRKLRKGGANFLVTSPEVANILEFTAGFKASVGVDSEAGSAGVVNVGSLSKKFDVYVDPYFPRNAILVGRKGKSFLESGYVYSPYIPLQMTPTVFDVDQFTPRKGIMTRYARKMVKPDHYGLVIVADLLG